MTIKKIALLAISSLFAAQANSGTVTFSLDNDGLFGVDQDYTNGLFLSYYSDEIAPPAFMAPISSSFGTFQGGASHKWGFTLGQTIYTPENIESAVPEENARPYAGVLYGQFDFANISGHRVDKYGLFFGSTGPGSLADSAQNFVHSITKSTEPLGWDYQVQDKILYNFDFETHNALLRLRSFGGLEHELKNVSRVMIGNYRTEVATGMMWRWGTGLDASVGASRMTIENSFNPGFIMQGSTGAHIFAGIEGRYRFNDVTIDGPLPEEVYPVTVNNTQATATIGAVWYINNFGASFTAAAKTADFEEDTNDLYGVGNLTLFAMF
ncbi:lipid A deacylase LpxR family protein [Vibrio makurazakiensis]|uniref:lipid A deacylase LpxR family protein n=1 Tax=Vibrio makurazakiensis TaxID=2910250 RepID=UPI003D0FF370